MKIPFASYEHLVRRASDPEKEKREALRKIQTPPDLGEALVTECPTKRSGKTLFGRGLITTQEGTVRDYNVAFSKCLLIRV